MARIFNSIRQRLLKESRFTRYLVYAVGEILLVVVGILIALQVNNWNQSVQERQAGAEYLVRIHRDLVQDTISFRQQISESLVLREQMKSLIDTLYGGVETLEQVRSMSAIYDRALDQVFTANDGTYKGMVDSGALGTIKSTELKEAIVLLYGEYDRMRALHTSIGGWMMQVATAETNATELIKYNKDVIDIFGGPDMLQMEDLAFMNDREDPRFKAFVRAISAAAFTQKASCAYYAELIKHCDRVLRQIDHELN